MGHSIVSQRLYASTVLLACLAVISRAQKPELSYCSPDLNSGLYNPMVEEFMSTGLCSDHCAGSFAFAILQDNSCWCSNYVPADQVDTSECHSGCPGISTEWCGNKDEGLYGYFQIPLGRPLGTSGDSDGSTPRTTSSVSTSRTSTSRSTPPFSEPRSPSTSLVTVASSQSSVRSSSSSTTTSSSSSSSSSSEQFDSTTSTSETASTPSTFITTVTQNGGPIITTIITSAPAATDDAILGQSSDGGGSGTSGGAIAGIVVGVVGGVAILAGLLIWFFCRRRRRSDEQSRTSSFTAERIGGSSSGNQSNSIPSRQVSQMSQAGLLGSKAPRIQTSGIGGGLGFDPRSPDASSNADRRSVGTDQRLNPWAIYKADDQMSSVSLHDDRDYSRQLRVANPDE